MNFLEKWGRGPVNNRLDFGGDPDHNLDAEFLDADRHHQDFLNDYFYLLEFIRIKVKR